MAEEKLGKSQRLLPPSPYETSLEGIARKRKIAQSLMESGMKGPGADARSWTQLLGSLAQAWAGKSIEKDADKKAAGIREAQAADYSSKNAQIAALMADPKKNRAEILALGNDPYFSEDPRIKAVAEAFKTAMVNGETWEKPENIIQRGADGTPTPTLTSFSKGGDVRTYNNMVAPTEGKFGPDGSFINPEDPANFGKNFQDRDNLMVMDPATGQWVPNQPVIEAKTQMAAAGAPSNSVYVDAQDKSFGKQIPEAVVAELTEGRKLGSQFIEALPRLQEAKRLLEKGIYAGAFGQATLDFARVGTALGMTGRSTQEKIANTQSYLRNMANQMFPILQALKPASDTDLLVAGRMAAGDLSLDPKSMMSAINSMLEAGQALAARHNSRVKELEGTFGANPEVRNGLSAFQIGQPGQEQRRETPAEMARRIREQRRRGGSGSGQSNFPPRG